MEKEQARQLKQPHLPDKTKDFFRLAETAMFTVRQLLEPKVSELIGRLLEFRMLLTFFFSRFVRVETIEEKHKLNYQIKFYFQKSIFCCFFYNFMYLIH